MIGYFILQLFWNLFFNPKRYNLGDVGRHRINRRMNLDVPANSTILHLEDFMVILTYLQGLRWQPALRTVPAYYDHAAYVRALAASAGSPARSRP